MAEGERAEKRLIATLRRLHRREPLRPGVRIDTLVGAAREPAGPVSPRHRGGRAPALSDVEWREAIDRLVADGRLMRDGRMVSLPGHRPGLEPVMRERVDRLLAGLRAAGATPPRVDGPAARLGVPPGVVAQLRASGELVTVAPGIDYPADVWEELDRRVDQLKASGPLSIARVRDALRTSRRHAEAILARHREIRRRAKEERRGRRPPRDSQPVR